MTVLNPTSRLVGRGSECETLAELVSAVQSGRSRVLIVRGEAGMGKSVLLRFVVEQSIGCQAAQAAGVESEAELAFAGLHQLCSPFFDMLPNLPEPQQEALDVAFGSRRGEAPDMFGVGAAVLTLLSEAAREQPLMCVVDDVQWLDTESAQTMEFVARRLAAAPIGMVFAIGRAVDDRGFDGLPELVLPGLRRSDAAALLQSVVAGTVAPRVRDRILAESHGNPLALLQLPRGVSAAVQLAFGGHAEGPDTPAVRRLEKSLMRRAISLPPESRQLLLTVAAEPAADVPLLWRAAGRLAISREAAAAAEAAGLIELRDNVRFVHPLVRSAVYRSATPPERREVHRALADVTDAEADPDRHAWHRAHSTVGPDEVVAAALEGSATQAMSQGGLAATAAFLEHAASLTPDPARRIRRLLDATQAKVNAGAFDDAAALLLRAEGGPLREAERARIQLLRGRASLATNHGIEALPELLAAARRLESLDPRLARDAYLDAFSASVFVGRLVAGTQAVEVAESALRAPSPATPQKRDALLEALAQRFVEGYSSAAPSSIRAVRAFTSEGVALDEALGFAGLAAATAGSLWDDTTWDALTRRQLETAREAGALSALPLALNSRTVSLLFAGQLAAASSLVEETRAVTEVTGSILPPYGEIALRAVRGIAEQAEPLIQACLDDVLARGEGVGVNVAMWARAVLFNGLGRYGEALDAARAAAADPLELGPPQWALAELVEAAVHTGDARTAREGLEHLSTMAHASGTDWALGVEASRRAMVSDGAVAEDLHRTGIAHLSRTTVRLELARAQLLYGEWLRRQGRSGHARAQLRSAYEALSAMGAEAFAERARHELHAAGEKADKRTLASQGDFTAQESQIAKLAAQGLTNAEIGAMLFISPRTVEWHLRNVFNKLGVKTRRELRRLLPNDYRTGPE